MGNSVSVIIPTWSRAACLERAIRSCLAQTLPVLEILVCDDGSTDGTEQLVNSFTDPRIKWCPGERGGRPAIPRNRGIRISRGDWLAFLDDDDEWFPNKIERQLALAETSSCRAIAANALRILPGKGVAGALLTDPAERLNFALLLKKNYVICSSVLLHRSLLPTVEGFPGQLELCALEDYALWLRVATQTDFACLPDPLLNYADNPQQSIRSNSLDELVQRLLVLKDFLAWSAHANLPAEYRHLARRRFHRLRGRQFADCCRRLVARWDRGLCR